MQVNKTSELRDNISIIIASQICEFSDVSCVYYWIAIHIFCDARTINSWFYFSAEVTIYTYFICFWVDFTFKIKKIHIYTLACIHTNTLVFACAFITAPLFPFFFQSTYSTSAHRPYIGFFKLQSIFFSNVGIFWELWKHWLIEYDDIYFFSLTIFFSKNYINSTH